MTVFLPIKTLLKMKAVAPKTLKQLVAVFTTIGALIAVLTRIETVGNFIVPNGQLLSWPFLISCAVTPAFITFLIYNFLWFKEQDEHKKTMSDKELLEARLKVYEAELISDPITGIPNNRKLIKDIDKILEHNRALLSQINSTAAPSQYQLVQIDLNDFKNLNRKAGERKADIILRLLAQSVYKTMRRNEDMYHLDPSNKVEVEGYRKYPGGDEFIFLLKGPHKAAVGFTKRIMDKFEEFKGQVQEIAGFKYQLGFCSAIAQLNAESDFDDIQDRLSKCLKRSSLSDKSYSMCWNDAESDENDMKENEYNEYKVARGRMDVMTLSRDQF